MRCDSRSPLKEAVMDGLFLLSVRQMARISTVFSAVARRAEGR